MSKQTVIYIIWSKNSKHITVMGIKLQKVN